jgi:methenyltetrahydromethanopterin cyclohydrolase
MIASMVDWNTMEGAFSPSSFLNYTEYNCLQKLTTIGTYADSTNRVRVLHTKIYMSHYLLSVGDSVVSVNERAAEIAKKMVFDKDVLKIGVKKLENESLVLDCGIEKYGGLMAGKLYSEACMGGLATVEFSYSEFGIQVNVSTDYPKEACMASQFAGWRIKVGDYFALGSGPARALAREEKLFKSLGYEDNCKEAVIALETRTIPSEEVASYIAEKAGVSPEGLYILIAPTASLVGSVQISARIVETGLHKLHELGFSLDSVLSGFGTCPVARVAKSDLKAMGITNDCILYGGQTRYFADCEDDQIESIIEKVPSSSSKDYGLPFYETFKKYDKDFYKIDPNLFSPAKIFINNVKTGTIYHAGGINRDVLHESLGP